jgi:23S rRNA (cytidine1920-2'-O)/16S rRNA (cytidine1409-2'-O)-methyltransferase
VGRGGVVRDPLVHRKVLTGLFATAQELGLGITALTASPLRGPAGNVEFLALLAPGPVSIPMGEEIERVIVEAPS